MLFLSIQKSSSQHKKFLFFPFFFSWYFITFFLYYIILYIFRGGCVVVYENQNSRKKLNEKAEKMKFLNNNLKNKKRKKRTKNTENRRRIMIHIISNIRLIFLSIYKAVCLYTIFTMVTFELMCRRSNIIQEEKNVF